MLSRLVNNKWFSGAIPALFLHISIGSVYCWSLFKANIAENIGSSLGLTEWAFSLAIFFLGMSAAFCGNMVEKNVKFSAIFSTIMFTIGMIGTGFSIMVDSLIGVYLFYGVVMGIGLGIGYLTPVKTLMLWFKDNKGLATGIAITGFGLAKVIASPILEYLQLKFPIEHVFFILGGIYFVLMLIGSLLIKKPKDSKQHKGERFTLQKSFKIIFSPTYILIWTVFFINISCGLALISQEKAIISSIGITSGIGTIAALTAFFNSFGRFGYSTLSDRLNDRSTVYKIIFFTCFLCCLTSFIVGISEFTIFIPLVVLLTLFITNLGYGGGFSTLPSLISDIYSMKDVSVIHGFALSAWAWAGLIGNTVGLYIMTNYGLYVLLLFLGTFYLLSLFLTSKIK